MFAKPSPPAAPPQKPKSLIAGGCAKLGSRKDNDVPNERLRQFNELKMRIHRKLVDRLDVTRIGDDGDEVREQVREVVTDLCEQEEALLNYAERQRLVTEILDETFGLGPLEVILSDPSVRSSACCRTKRFRTFWSTGPKRSTSSGAVGWS